MEEKVIKFKDFGDTKKRGEAMSYEQILLLIINYRLYNSGAITKEQMDKISANIKSEYFVEKC